MKVFITLSAVILSLLGIYLGMVEEPRLDYTAVWEELSKELREDSEDERDSNLES